MQETIKNIEKAEGEIMYVSKLLRHKFKKRKKENNFEHRAEYYENFCKYCEKF